MPARFVEETRAGGTCRTHKHLSTDINSGNTVLCGHKVLPMTQDGLMLVLVESFLRGFDRVIFCLFVFVWCGSLLMAFVRFL